jgi:hypothetical protein
MNRKARLIQKKIARQWGETLKPVPKKMTGTGWRFCYKPEPSEIANNVRNLTVDLPVKPS